MLLVVSCYEQKDKQENVICLNTTQTAIPIDSLFSNMNLIYLNEPDSMLAGEINKIVKHDSIYYLLDSKKSKTLFGYDARGNYLSSYDSLGGGPGEYFAILDFDVDRVNNEIAILCSPPKLIFTDLHLSFKKELPLGENHYERISVSQDNVFVFSYYGEIVEEYNRNGELLGKTSIMNNLLIGNAFFPQNVFYKTSNKHLMQSPGDENIYIEKNGKWIKHIYIEYDNKTSSERLYTKKKVEDVTFEEKLSNPLPYIKSIFEYKQQIYFLYLYGFLHYLNDGENNFLFSELPGIASLNYDNGHFYTWDYLSNFSLEDPDTNRKLQNIKIETFGKRQKDQLEDGILIIDYVLKKN